MKIYWGALVLGACGAVSAPPPDANVVTNFTVAVTVGGTGTGRVTSTPAGIDCPTNCSATFPSGTAVMLTAAAQTGAAFAGFTGDCAGLDKSCMVTADADKAVTATFAVSGEKRFAKQIEGSYLTTIASDAAGHIVVAGSVVGSSVATYISMRSGADGSVIWETTMDGVQYPALAVAPTGEIIFSAWYTGTPTVGGRVLANGGATDFFVAKLSPSDGSVMWVKEFGGDRQDSTSAVAVSSTGTIFLAGYFFSTSFAMGTTTLANSSTAPPFYSDAFAAALSGTDGSVLWAKQYGVGTNGETASGVTVDSQGNPVIDGSFAAAVNFGGGFFFTAQSTDCFAIRLRATDGTTQLGKQIGSTGVDFCRDATTTPDGFALTGPFQLAQSFGGPTIANQGGYDAFVVRYTTGGAYTSAAGMGGTGNETPAHIHSDSQGALVVTGYFDAPTNLGGSTLSNAGGYDAFLVKLSPTDGHLWSYRFGGGQSDYGQGVTVDPHDSVFVIGTFAGTADVAGETFTTTANSASFLVSYWP